MAVHTHDPTQGKGLFFVNDTESSYRLKLFLEQFHVRSAVLNAELPLNSRLHILQVREPEGFVLWSCGVWCATVNQHDVDVNIGGARGKWPPNGKTPTAENEVKSVPLRVLLLSPISRIMPLHMFPDFTGRYSTNENPVRPPRCWQDAPLSVETRYCSSRITEGIQGRSSKLS